MELPIEVIVFWLLLLDSLVANLIAYLGPKWYAKHFQFMSRLFPLTKAWAGAYLALVVWIGFILYRAGLLY